MSRNVCRNRPARSGVPDCVFGCADREDACRKARRAISVALGVNLEGNKEVLGFCTSATEGAKFWLQILSELRNRGVQDLLVACVDGLRGFPDAIATVYPKTQVQLCIVHTMRNSLNL